MVHRSNISGVELPRGHGIAVGIEVNKRDVASVLDDIVIGIAVIYVATIPTQYVVRVVVDLRADGYPSSWSIGVKVWAKYPRLEGGGAKIVPLSLVDVPLSRSGATVKLPIRPCLRIEHIVVVVGVSCTGAQPDP